jgi:hypothetical protein
MFGRLQRAPEGFHRRHDRSALGRRPASIGHGPRRRPGSASVLRGACHERQREGYGRILAGGVIRSWQGRIVAPSPSRAMRTALRVNASASPSSSAASACGARCRARFGLHGLSGPNVQSVLNPVLLGRVDKKVSRSVTAMIQGWKLGASHDPRPDRHRSLGADRPVSAA